MIWIGSQAHSSTSGEVHKEVERLIMLLEEAHRDRIAAQERECVAMAALEQLKASTTEYGPRELAAERTAAAARRERDASSRPDPASGDDEEARGVVTV